MDKSFISLKKNCNQRTSKELIPSVKDQVYSIQDFISPNFLDRLFSFHRPSDNFNIEPCLSTRPLLSFIEAVTQKIDDTKLFLDDLREAYITRAVAFCSEENKEYELDNLKREMRRSHLKIVQYGYNSSIAEEFVRSFDSYRTLNEKNQLFKAKEPMDDFKRCFDKKIESIVQACKEDQLPTPYMVTIEEAKDSRVQRFSEIQDKIVQMHQRKVFDTNVKLLKQNRQNYLTFISTTPPRFPQQLWKSQLEVLDLKSGTFGHPLRLPDRQPKDALPFELIDSLHLVVIPTFTSRRLDIYKLSSKKMQLVWRLSLQSIFTNAMPGTRFAFDIINPQNLLVIGYGQELKLVNIFTKKVVYERRTTVSNIAAISHMKSLNLLAVLEHTGPMRIYSIMSAKNSLRLEHTREIKFVNNSVRRIVPHSHSNSFIISEISHTMVLHRVQLQFNQIKQDRFDTQIAPRDRNCVSIAESSDHFLLSYGMISSTLDAISCTGIRTLGVSGEKFADVDVFKSDPMIALFDSAEIRVGYSTLENFIFIMSKGHDGESSYPERYFRQVCKLFIKRIVRNADMKEATTDKSIISAIKDDLRQLATIFGEIPVIKDKNAPHPLNLLLHDIWNVLKALFIKFNEVNQIIIKLCIIVKKCIRALGVDFSPYAVECFEIIEKGFLILPVPEFLYILETSVSVLANVPEMTEPLMKTYELVSEQTLLILSKEDIEDRDELCEDFFGLMFRYTKYLPSVILSSKTLEESLQLAQTMIATDQLSVQKTLCLFLEYLFQLPRENPQNDVEKAATEILLNKYGGIYIKLLILKLMEYLSQKLKDYICDVIFASFTRMKKQTIEWIEEAFEEDSENVLSESEKEDMLKNLNKIDVSNLKLAPKDEEETKELAKISDKFNEVFDIFDCEED